MPESRRRKIAKRPLRVLFRWFRIAVLLLITALIGSYLWSNLVGLPRVVSREIQNELRTRGINLDFGRVRLKGLKHLVAENVRLRGLESTNSPAFDVREAEFLIDYQQLRNGEFRVSGVRLFSGSLVLPVDSVSGRSLTVSNITADVLLLPGDKLRVVDFSAETLGARATVSGELTRFSKFRFTTGPDDEAGQDWQRQLGEVMDIAEQLQFSEPPEISVSILADGADVPGARASVMLRSGRALSGWGAFDRLEISSTTAPSASNEAVRANFLAQIRGFRTGAGTFGSMRMEGETVWSRNMERLMTNRVELRVENPQSKWFRTGRVAVMLDSSQDSADRPIRSVLTLDAQAVELAGMQSSANSLRATLDHPLPFPTPAVWLRKLFAGSPESAVAAPAHVVAGSWELDLSAVKTSRAALDSVHLQGDVQIPEWRAQSDRDLGFWRFLAPLEIPWELNVTNIHSGEISIGSLRAGGRWHFPRMDLLELEAELHGGELHAEGGLDVGSREVSATVRSNFDYEQAAFLFDEPVQRWLSQFQWTRPPLIQSAVAFLMPSWTNWASELRRDVITTLQLDGRLEGSGSFRGVPVDLARTSFGFSNFVWNLPDMVVRRPEGEAQIAYSGNVTNAEFHCRVESRIDPSALQSLFAKEHQLALEVVKFAQPPLVEAEIWGDWDDPSRLGVRASVLATNFFVKEQAFSDIQGRIEITNQLIHCRDIVAHRGKEEARAPYLRIDLPGEVMFVTNVVSTIDPYIAMSLVGDEAYEAIDPYRFAVTPTVKINGIVPLRHWSKADLGFEVAGNEFAFWRFRMPSLAGNVYWRSNTISFSNVVANFYGGDARWSGHFVVDPRKGEDYATYSFAGQTTNTELRQLVADLTGRTNHMEGILHGNLVITSANTRDDRSWNGYGNASIEDGFLWNVPIFGVFSPILDGIAPGLGSSRVSAGTGTFDIANSVVSTTDMQVRAPAFRLAYKGSVDLDGNLDANAEALILRDMWVFGKLFSVALWPLSKAFEARISGTLDAPKTELRYVPKFLLAPFRAIGAMGAATGQSKEQSEKTLRAIPTGREAPSNSSEP